MPGGRNERAARSPELKDRETELHRWVAVCRASYPRVHIHAAPVVGMGARALVVASRRAGLLALGSALSFQGL